MPLEIVSADVDDLHQVLEDHARYWGERDLRALHQPVLVREFGATCLVARAEEVAADAVLGFVTPDHTGYVHLIATRDDSRGTGVGRRLHTHFAELARGQGAVRLKAITSVTNEGSIAFHRTLGFDARVVEDYDGPGRPMVVFTRSL